MSHTDSLTGFSGLSSFVWEHGADRLQCSEEVSRLIGRPAGPRTGDEFLSAFEPDERRRLKALFDHARRHGDTHWADFRVTLPDGGLRVLNIRLRQGDSPPELRGLVLDVTASQARQPELTHPPVTLDGVGHYTYDIAEGVSWWSPGTFRLYDMPPKPTVNPRRDMLNRIHPDDRPRLQAMVERAIRSAEPFEICYRVMLRDGGIRWLLDRGQTLGPFDPETGLGRQVKGTKVDVTRLRETLAGSGCLGGKTPDTSPHASAEELQVILDNCVAFVGLLDTDGTLREANAPALVAGGLTRDEVIGRKFWETYWWAYDRSVAERLQGALARAASGETVRYDEDVLMQGGRIMSIDFLLSPITDATGAVVRIVASGFDITERKKSEEHVRLLMGEINHRSKNVLALVQSVARMTGKSAPHDFLPAFEARLQALARSYDLLLREQADGVAMHDLVRAQLAHFGDLLDLRIRLEGPELYVTGDTAQTLGMALHELATNAGKYGALSNEHGEVSITWARQGAADEGGARYEICWRETDGPPVKPPEREGFGSRVLGTMAQSTLGGEVSLTYHPEGVEWRAAFDDSCLVD